MLFLKLFYASPWMDMNTTSRAIRNGHQFSQLMINIRSIKSENCITFSPYLFGDSTPKKKKIKKTKILLSLELDMPTLKLM